MDSVQQLLAAALERIRSALSSMPGDQTNDNNTSADESPTTGENTEDPTVVLVQDSAIDEGSETVAGIPGDTPYNLTQQPSSHNSYEPETHALTIAEQFEEYGIHSFELDIHSGDPGLNKFPFFDGDQRPDGDYYVYHATFDSGTHYPYLSDGLQDVYGLDNELPVTLFIDLKNSPFEHDGQGIPAFEALLDQELQEKLYTPQDIIDRVPGATTLQEAIDQGGWPTVEELEGRVLVVLTGSDDALFEYSGEGPAAADMNAFIAPRPDVVTQPEWYIDLGNNEVDIGPDVTNLNAYPEAIFYNMPEGQSGDASVVHDNGYVSRIYGFDEVGEESQSSDAQHLGTDHINPDENEWSESVGEEFNTIDPPDPVETASETDPV